MPSPQELREQADAHEARGEELLEQGDTAGAAREFRMALRRRATAVAMEAMDAGEPLSPATTDDTLSGMTDAQRLAKNLAISSALGGSPLARACAQAKPPTTISALAKEIGVDKAALWRYAKGRAAPADVVEKVWKRVRFRLKQRD